MVFALSFYKRFLGVNTSGDASKETGMDQNHLRHTVYLHKGFERLFEQDLATNHFKYVHVYLKLLDYLTDNDVPLQDKDIFISWTLLFCKYYLFYAPQIFHHSLVPDLKTQGSLTQFVVRCLAKSF